jgi:beta-1,4-mannosyltransferase
VAHVVCLVRRTQLVIDWHNYGYTILAMSRGKSSLALRFYEWYERLLGRGASVNFCVSKAMQRDLARNWNIKYASFFINFDLVYLFSLFILFIY